MPRVAGQIDVAKNEAILDAAVEVFSERGVAAPMEEIARRACVSKQTIYNHYGSKSELVRAILERRVDEITAPLDFSGAEDDPEAALTIYAERLLIGLTTPGSYAIARAVIQGSHEMPDLAKAFFEAGPAASRQRLAQFLTVQHRAGHVAIDDPDQAAEFFAGMVIGAHQIRALLGLPPALNEDGVADRAAEITRRFLRAYRP